MPQIVKSVADDRPPCFSAHVERLCRAVVVGHEYPPGLVGRSPLWP